MAQVKAFREGFSTVFPVRDMRTFTPDELVLLFGNADEDWSVETLRENIRADHGYSADSRAIRFLVEVMSSASSERGFIARYGSDACTAFEAKDRRQCLQFSASLSLFL